jgi:methanogenic corrinoid protein MtbC1
VNPAKTINEQPSAARLQGLRLASILDEISSSIGNLRRPQEVCGLVNVALSQNIPVADIVDKGLRSGLQQVGAKYEAGEYFLAELLFAASIVDETMQIVRPKLHGQAIQKKGTILLGTVRGDIHDIGKNIFRMMADAAGFAVHDLGVDVDPELFVEQSKRIKPNIVGLSCLLTTGLSEIAVVVDQFEKSNMRNKVRVLIGGNAVTKEFGQEIGADAVALNAVEGVEFCRGAIDP